MAEEWVNFWGVIVAALIGALTLLLTATMVQGNFKADKLAEAKRDVFLKLVDSWMSYLLNVNSFRIQEVNEYRNIIFQSNKELVSSLHKSSFVSDPATKKEIMEFTIYFSLENLKLNSLIFAWFNPDEKNRSDLEYKSMMILEDLGNRALSLQKKLRCELGVKNDPEIDLYLEKIQKDFANEMKQYLFSGTKFK
jgi:hypothetical protein